MLNIFQFTSVLLGFIIISVASNQIAKTFRLARLPLITGLIITGIAAGPFVLNLIPATAKNSLWFVNDIALAYIAFAAGAELYLGELRSHIKSIQINSLVQSVIGFVLTAVIIVFVSDYVPFVQDLNFENKLAFSLLTAVLFVAPSPASVIAVISELRAKGPFTRTVLGITMIKDFMVVILFAVILSISKSFVDGYGINPADFAVIFAELLLSFGVAYIVGKLLHAIFKWGRVKWLKTFLILLTGLLMYTFSHFFKDFSRFHFHHEIYFEPLLICLIASFYITNYTKYRPEFLEILQDISLYIYVAFFTLTGASMDLTVLSEVWALSLLFFFVRLVTIVIGSYSGNFLSKEPLKYAHVSWFPYVAQAGVALGLVMVVAAEFPGWGDDFATLSIAVIVINQLVGPPLITRAIYFVGEARDRAAAPEFDGVKDALILGLESQSIALAMQLKEKGWTVEIATQKTREEVADFKEVPLIHFNDISVDFFNRNDGEKYDAIIGMMSDEQNLRMCEIVYQNIGTKDIVVRLNDRGNLEKFRSLGVRVVDPSTAIVSLLDHFVRSPQATSLLLGLEAGKDTWDLEITNEDLHGITLRDLRLPPDVIILSVMRGGNLIITHGYTRLRLGDVVTLVGSNKSLDEVQLKFTR